MNTIQCTMCGACCIAYDISTLDKAAGTPCAHLSDSGKCTNYSERPWVCRAFQPDELCVLIGSLPLSEKIKVIRQVYGI